MAVTYLKKKKMYELAVSICPDVPALKDCKYDFYRGAEWFGWHSDEECEDGYISFVLYHCSSYHSLEKVQHLDSEFKRVTLDRKVFPHVRTQVL